MSCMHQTCYNPVNLENKKSAPKKNGVNSFELQRVQMGFSKQRYLPSLNTDNVIFRNSQVESLNCNDSQVRSY